MHDMKQVLRIICFSKDRPFQLKECLRTMHLFLLSDMKGKTDFSIEILIIFTFSHPAFAAGYQSVQSLFPHVQFVQENESSDFRSILIQSITHENPDFIFFCVDDVLFYNHLDLVLPMTFLNEDPEGFVFHLKLNPHCCYSQTMKQSMLPLPKFHFNAKISREFLIFQSNPRNKHDWNYPFDLCASMYRGSDIQELIQKIILKNPEALTHPNRFEIEGNRHYSNALCACPVDSILSVITINRVQSIFTNNDIFHHPQGDIFSLQQAFDTAAEFDTEYYRHRRFPSVHIGDFVLRSAQAKEGDTKAKASPLVSVIMPVKDSTFLEPAVESILNQTYPNIEFLICLDGDDRLNAMSRKILEQVTTFHHAKKNVVRVIENTSCQGIGASLNRLLALATGTYVARMDADDVSARHRIETQVAFLESNHDIDCVGSAIEIIGRSSGSSEVVVYPTRASLTHWRMTFGSFVAHPTMMFRKKEERDETDIVYAQDQAMEDYELWLRLLKSGRGKKGCRMMSLGNVLLQHRKHDHNTSSKSRSSTTSDDYGPDVQLCQSYLEDQYDIKVGPKMVQILKDPFPIIDRTSVEELTTAYQYLDQMELLHDQRMMIHQQATLLPSQQAIDRTLVLGDVRSRQGILATLAMEKGSVEGQRLWMNWTLNNLEKAKTIVTQLASKQ